MTLRRNPPEVQVTNGQKPSTKIIYIVLQTAVGLSKYLLKKKKKIISSTTKCRKQMLNFVRNTTSY